MKIRAILFDVYGTLLEVGPPPPDADSRWRRLCRELLGSEPPLGRLDFSIATNKVIARRHAEARARGISWPEIYWPSVVADVIPAFAQLPPETQAEFLYHQVQTGHSTRMAGVTAAALRHFKEHRCSLGIASNAQAYTLRELRTALAAHRLGMDLFEPHLCFWSFEHGFSKPDPHVFQILTARLEARGIIAQEALMVGDRLDNDVVPAKTANWQTWHLSEQGDGDWHRLHLTFNKTP